MRRRLPVSDLLPFVLLFLLPCLLLWPVFQGRVFLPAELLRDVAPWRTDDAHTVPWNPLMWDGIAEFYPWRLFAARTLHAGYLPLWNPHEFCGTPFFANAQSAILYPLNLLFWLLPVDRAFGVSVIVHLGMTGCFLYGFLRSDAFGLSRPAAMLGAVAWQLSTWQVDWLALPTFLCVSTWIPLALWLTHRLCARPAAGRASALGVCLGVMFLAGHLQIALYGVGLTLAYAVFCLLAQPKARRREILKWGLLSVGLFVGLAAAQLLPSVELSHQSHRAGTPVTWSGYLNYVKIAMHPAHLVTLFLPGFFGNPTQGTYWGLTNAAENACSLGLSALTLSLLGIGGTWKADRRTRFFAVTAIITLLMAIGTPLDAVPYFLIPGFAQSASPGRILVLWTLCASVLAAIGAEQALRSPKKLWKALGLTVGLGIAAFGLTALWVLGNGKPGTLSYELGQESLIWNLAGGILIGLAALTWLHQRGMLPRRAYGAGLAALAAAELFAMNGGYNRTAAPDDVYPVTPALAWLQQHAGVDRVMPLNRKWSLYQAPAAVLPPNAATVYGLSETQGYDSLQTGRYFQYAIAMNGGEAAAPRENGNMVFTRGLATPQGAATAARYALSLGPVMPGPALSPVMQDGAAALWENAAALPRARMEAGAAQIVSSDIPTRLLVQTDGGRELTVADQWDAGWRARVNGSSVSVKRTEEVFRGVTLPSAGPARVEMRYEPTSVRLGLYALCLALGAACAAPLAGLGAVRRRPRSAHPTTPAP